VRTRGGGKKLRNVGCDPFKEGLLGEREGRIHLGLVVKTEMGDQKGGGKSLNTPNEQRRGFRDPLADLIRWSRDTRLSIFISKKNHEV